MTTECYAVNIKGHSFMTANLTLYSDDLSEAHEDVYKISGYRIVDSIYNPDEVREIEDAADAASIDPSSEYLILYLKDGETATFRNSYVMMDLHHEKV